MSIISSELVYIETLGVNQKDWLVSTEKSNTRPSIVPRHITCLALYYIWLLIRHEFKQRAFAKYVAILNLRNMSLCNLAVPKVVARESCANRTHCVTVLVGAGNFPVVLLCSVGYGYGAEDANSRASLAQHNQDKRKLSFS